MKVVELASAIAKIEGHKSQSRIGDIREILSIIADLSYRNAVHETTRTSDRREVPTV